ncbi:Rieske 2Fe-2S domain-containing protein [Pseudomonas sp. 18175]|uniref:Rieske 2Fe-2S domain-containing protein n=1 Tax=Pseudomonas sp. 18175 TaxID=3390056 RepID=UPI003D1B84B1
MKSVELNLNQACYVVVEEKIYFLRQQACSTQMLPTTCPHRGGPLHLAEMAEDGQRLICPWHANAYSICNLEKTSLPIVRVRDQISAVIGDAEYCTTLFKPSRYGAGLS